MNGLVVDHQKCTGCRMCELACSTHFDSTGFNPRMSAIRVRVVGVMEADVPLVCMQCEDAPCAEACPASAFHRASSGALAVDKELCVNCGACVSACRYGVIHMDERQAVPIKCDLCGGEPLCVSYCVAEAIAFSPSLRADWPEEKRTAYTQLMARMGEAKR